MAANSNWNFSVSRTVAETPNIQQQQLLNLTGDLNLAVWEEEGEIEFQQTIAINRVSCIQLDQWSSKKVLDVWPRVMQMIRSEQADDELDIQLSYEFNPNSCVEKVQKLRATGRGWGVMLSEVHRDAIEDRIVHDEFLDMSLEQCEQLEMLRPLLLKEEEDQSISSSSSSRDDDDWWKRDERGHKYSTDNDSSSEDQKKVFKVNRKTLRRRRRRRKQNGESTATTRVNCKSIQTAIL
jgi:hypothetical protein